MKIQATAFYAAVGLLANVAYVYAPAKADSILTKADAIEKTLIASPSLEAARYRIEEMDQAISQANVKPNPIIEGEVENFTGTGPFTGLDRTELTVSYAQQLERGNKRGYRTQLARNEALISEAEWHVERLDLIYSVEKAYVDAVATKAELETQQGQLVLLKQIEGEIQKRVKAGKASDLAAQNAALRTMAAETKIQEVEQKLDAAKLALASLWGSTSTAFMLDAQDATELPKSITPIAEDALLDGPDLAVWYQKEQAGSAALGVEKAKAIQDPTVRFGLRYDQETSDVAVVAGVSIPLAFHDTNQGNISRARAAINRSRYETMDAERTLSRQLMMAQSRQLSAFKVARQLTASLEAAEKAKELALERMQKGAASYLDVFAAQSLFTDVELQKLSAAHAFHLAQADINRLTATYSTDAIMPAKAIAMDAGDDTGSEGN